MKLVFPTLFLIAACAHSAYADSLKALENFAKTVQSGKAEFVQTVTSPAKAGEAPRVKTSTGSFEFSRPNRFRFAYKKPFEQLILADGQHLWIYDADLNQASQKKQSEAFANTPAALIASSPDLSALRKEFELQALPDQAGLSWVQARPRAEGSSLQSVRIALRGNSLAQLDIIDSFGQRSQIEFKAMQINPALGNDHFQFILPPKAELIKP